MPVFLASLKVFTTPPIRPRDAIMDEVDVSLFGWLAAPFIPLVALVILRFAFQRLVWLQQRDLHGRNRMTVPARRLQFAGKDDAGRQN